MNEFPEVPVFKSLDRKPEFVGTIPGLPASKNLYVIVKFGSEIPLDIQGKALLAFERTLRELSGHKLWIEVFKETKGDDSKLRSQMTPEQRRSL